MTIDNLTPRPSGSWSNDGVNLEEEVGSWSTEAGADDDADVDEDEEGEEGDAEGEHSAD